MRTVLRQFARALRVNVRQKLSAIPPFTSSASRRHFAWRTSGEGNIITSKSLVIIQHVIFAIRGGVCHEESSLVVDGKFDGRGTGDFCRGGRVHLRARGVDGDASRGGAAASGALRLHRERASNAGACIRGRLAGAKNYGRRKFGASVARQNLFALADRLPARNIARALAIASEFLAPRSVFGMTAIGTLSGAGHR